MLKGYKGKQLVRPCGKHVPEASRLEALRCAIQVGSADFEQGRFAAFESTDALGHHLASVAAKAVAGA